MKYPVGIQSFKKIREMGFAYADKTMFIGMMLSSPGYYFLSRPRRFGKSLFISTLQTYFEGHRELFRGLAIDTRDTDWSPRPVINLSLNTIDPKSETSLSDYIGSVFREYEDIYGIDGSKDQLSRRFEIIIKKASEMSGRKVAVLVDEYDAPLLGTLDNETLNASYRATLKAIFSVLKSADDYIYFAFITGVSRFSHTSLFSGANNLEDISLDPRYSAICGISENELREYFMPGIHDFAEKQGISDEEMLSLMKENYDGYHFNEASPDIYNPFSLIHALKSQKISNYWFQSGTPSFLLSVLKRDDFYLPLLDCLESTPGNLSSSESYLQNPVTLLYEAGYVTIKRYDEDIESYILSLPNKEVAESFTEALLPVYSALGPTESRDSLQMMRKAVLKGDADNFMRHLRTFLAGNPYSNTELAKRERYFKNNIYLVLRALGFQPRCEEETCCSRMDVMLRTRHYIYIFELKTDGDTTLAMGQIDERGYTLPYADEGRRIIRIAANYSSSANNIDSWQIVTH